MRDIRAVEMKEEKKMYVWNAKKTEHREEKSDDKETERKEEEEEERKKDFIQSKPHWTPVAAFVHSYHFFLSCQQRKIANTRVCITD
jgi:hypothetical protein